MIDKRHPVIKHGPRATTHELVSSFLVLSPLGAPVGLLVPLAMVAFIVVVYALLAFRYGLSEATRLTRSIGGFFSASPPP